MNTEVKGPRCTDDYIGVIGVENCRYLDCDGLGACNAGLFECHDLRRGVDDTLKGR